jgi:homoserine O-succinyltransferase/O-acetyltransferase
MLQTSEFMKAALLDLNNNTPNKSIGYLKTMLTDYGLAYQPFEVRYRGELPDMSFDIYISSGGPGSPFDDEENVPWNERYFDLLDHLWEHNLKHPNHKKYVFFICHSFQLACRHFKIGRITKRAFKSFGTFPVYQSSEGMHEPLFAGLQKPFWIADFREWQVIDPDIAEIEAKQFKILAWEKPNTKRLPRAIMAIRFSDAFFATQFHPEADAGGMLAYFKMEEKKQEILLNYGKDKYEQMIRDLTDESKIEKTYQTILPAFFEHTIEMLKKSEKIVNYQ